MRCGGKSLETRQAFPRFLHKGIVIRLTMTKPIQAKFKPNLSQIQAKPSFRRIQPNKPNQRPDLAWLGLFGTLNMDTHSHAIPEQTSLNEERS
jgi:hypothetical protein